MQQSSSKQSIIWRLAPAFLLIVFTTAGCFRPVGDEIQPTLVSQGIPTATPTATPQPTATDTPTPTIAVEETQEVSVDDESLDVMIADVATATPTFEATSVAQDAGQPSDPFVLTATVLVREITQTAEFSITQTAEALGIGATPTPTATATPQVLATQAFATQPQTIPSVGGTCVHEVVAGENLFRLSLRYGVSINELAQASGITNIQLITVGQKITIPGCGTTGVLPPPTSVPTATISAVTGTTNSGFAAQSANPGTTGTTTTSTGVTRTHVVQQYETLFEISLQYGVSMQSIANANGITNTGFIIIGDELIIPAQ